MSVINGLAGRTVRRPRHAAEIPHPAPSDDTARPNVSRPVKDIFPHGSYHLFCDPAEAMRWTGPSVPRSGDSRFPVRARFRQPEQRPERRVFVRFRRYLRTESLIAIPAPEPRFFALHRAAQGRRESCACLKGGTRLQPAQDIIRNELLAGLSAADFALLAPLLSWVELPARRQLEIRHRRIDHVYFIESGIVSMVISAGAQHSIEIGLVGSEA